MTATSRFQASPITGASRGDLMDLFEDHASARPDAIALTLEGEALTYGELNARANQLAADLRELGVGSDSLVGIYLDRSFDLIVGILAILKAGGAYLPLDLACPEDRLAFQLADSGAPVVLTETSLAGRLKDYAGTIVALDGDRERLRPAAGRIRLL